ncbi:MAG: hypothetical protein KC621_18760 [Myxococcales bacterium]|nr:hypothetical protein [Myxococcales bacterium]
MMFIFALTIGARACDVIPNRGVVPPGTVFVALSPPNGFICDGDVDIQRDVYPYGSIPTIVSRSDQITRFAPVEPLTLGESYEVWQEDPYGVARRGAVLVGDVPPPDVSPTWTVERDAACSFDGYHTRARVDIGTVASGVLRLESAEDDLRVYGAMDQSWVHDFDLGLGSAAPCVSAQFSDVTDTVLWSDVRCLAEQPECLPPLTDDLMIRYCAGRPRTVHINATFPDAARFGRARIVEHNRYYLSGVVVEEAPIEGEDRLDHIYHSYDFYSLDVELLDWRGRIVASASLPPETEPELCDGPFADSGLQDTGGAEPTDESEPEPRRCGCATSTSSGAWWVVGLSVVWTRRRRGATIVRREST